ncbi:MAG: hypothetical protein ABI678_15710 [Kofleriaceae bacterium]
MNARLAALRAMYVPETIAEARHRLAGERPPFTRELTSASVDRALRELRALLELSSALHHR